MEQDFLLKIDFEKVINDLIANYNVTLRKKIKELTFSNFAVSAVFFLPKSR